MNINDLCINCFQPTGGEEVCMHCGHIQTDKPRQICHLYPHTILYDRYLIGRVINNGGFGVVYKAYDMRLETVVAIKELLPTQNSMVTRMPPSQEVIPVNAEKNEQFKTHKLKFMDEARVIAQFSKCDSIVRVFDFFETNNTAYLVMEFLDGETLRERLNRSSEKMGFDEAMNIMMPIMNALKIVHEQGIVHKDISPDNIFLCSDGRVKLIDFGAAKFGEQETPTDTNSVIMKPGYTPPEQYRSNGKIGPFSDIYSVGAVFYTITTGQVPDESIDRLEKDNLQRPTKLGADIPIYSEKAIMKALALKEDVRFKTMNEFINAVTGKKKADYPEVEIKKRKILRAVVVTAAFALMITAVASTYMIKMHNNIIPSKSAEITVWYVDSGDDEVNARYEKLAEGFTDFAGDVDEKLDSTKVKFVPVKSDEYDAKLKKAFEDGNAPDVFQVTNDEQEEHAANINDVYSNIKTIVNNEEDDTSVSSDKTNDISDIKMSSGFYAKAFNAMCDELQAHNCIAPCFDMPVLYAYTNSKKTDNQLPAGDTSLDDLLEAKPLKGFKYSVVCNPETVLDASYAYGYDGGTQTDTVEKLYNASRTYEKKKFRSPQKVFIKSGDAMYYIGYISEFSDIKAAVDSFKDFDCDVLTGETTEDMFVFPEMWSVNADSSSLNQKAAKFYLYYLFRQDGQENTFKVDNKTYYLPMNELSIKYNVPNNDKRLKLYKSDNDGATALYSDALKADEKADIIVKSAKNSKGKFSDIKDEITK